MLEFPLLGFGLLVPLVIAVAYFTLIERKLMALLQHRQGPIFIGFFGLLQPFADGLKLILKETIIPTRSNNFLFSFSPVLTFTLSLIGWCFIPFNYITIGFNFELGVFGILLFSSLNVYTIILSGWASNSYYAFFGSLRAISQMLSYEISLGFSILFPVLYSSSMNLIDIVLAQNYVYFIFPFLPAGITFLISIIAETNRAPFDLPEAEAELVAGYNVEYSAILFALFFLGEYSGILAMSCFCITLFFGGWLLPVQLFFLLPGVILSFKVCIMVFLFIFIRANLPRYRYDQLLVLGWTVFLPLTFCYFIFQVANLFYFNSLPNNQDFFFWFLPINIFK